MFAGFTLRPATAGDLSVILGCIRGLAEYERLAHQCIATEELLRASLFGERPAAQVVLAFAGDEPAGFALWFQSYSTFLARPGLYLEDLFVYPQYRGQGLGRQLLRHLARVAVEQGYGRVEWSVLDWNVDAIRFYRSLGAELLHDWQLCRLVGDAIPALAAER